ncbi:MAG: 2-hydroxyacid dehydrogenase [Brevirhabdus sp.]
MTVKVLFAGRRDQWPDYKPALEIALDQAGIKAELGVDLNPADVDYIVYAPNGPVQDFTPYTRTKAVLSLWAGVESIVGNTTLTQPLARMVDPGMTEGMVEWVVGHVLRHHLGMDAHIKGQDGTWAPKAPPLARSRPVAVLGLGALGAAVAQALVALNFPVRGWSRSPKTIDGVACFHGDSGLTQALSGAHGVVTLLPATPATENILNTDTLGLLARGAFVVNPGRGPLIDDDALLAALDSGQLGHATLDVFRVEPLPKDHPFWAHPGVTVTPHIASETRIETASAAIVENIRRAEAGEPVLNLVDRGLGY